MGEIHGALSTYNPLTGGASTSFGLGPDSYGALEWNVSPALAGATTGATATGTIYGAKVPWRQPASQALSVIQLNINTAGATLSGSQAALFDMNGNIIGSAVSADAAMLGANYQTIAIPTSGALMSAAAAIAPYVYVALLAVGTTAPNYIRAANPTVNQLQWGASGNKLAWANLGNLSAQASIPSSITLANNAANGVAIVVGLK